MSSLEAGRVKPGAYLIFGLPGTGKSTVAKELLGRGFTGIDTDFEPNLSAWVNIVTGHRLASFVGFPFTQDWRNTHRWQWDEYTFNKLLRKSQHEPVFFCGDADNLEDFFPQFRLRFALYLNNETMTKRLKVRDPKRWNDTDPELAETLGWNKSFVESWKSDAITLIDADQPTEVIVKEILARSAE